MKKLIKSKFAIAFSVIALIAGLAYAQTSLHEIEGILQFRTANPKMRWQGTLSATNTAGTVAGALASARPALVVTAGRTLLPTDCGSVVINNATSSTQTFVLPAVANSGCYFTFLAGHADGETLINMAASGTCVVTVFGAVGADADTAIVTDATCNTGLKNTAATNAIGDSLTIVSDGTRWLGMGISSGIWATQ